MLNWSTLLNAEAAAVVLALAYVFLAIRQSFWCWPAAALSAAIYTMLFLEGRLYMESLLQLFYVAMAGYGLWQWKFAGTHGASLAVSTRPWRWHIVAVALVVVVSLAVSWLMLRYTNAEEVWLDTLTTVASLLTTWMVARKIVENWLYWVVIDAFYVYLFATKGFTLTAILYALYLAMAAYGFYTWRKSFFASRSA